LSSISEISGFVGNMISKVLLFSIKSNKLVQVLLSEGWTVLNLSDTILMFL